MRYLNIACYCVNFNDYDFLYEILRKLSFAGVGAELSMFTDDMDFMVQLLGERRRFAGYPITFMALIWKWRRQQSAVAWNI